MRRPTIHVDIKAWNNATSSPCEAKACTMTVNPIMIDSVVVYDNRVFLWKEAKIWTPTVVVDVPVPALDYPAAFTANIFAVTVTADNLRP